MSASGDEATGRTSSALAGAAASGEDIARIEAALLVSKDVRRIIHMQALHLESGELMIGVKIDISADATMREVSAIVGLAEKRVRDAVPAAALVYIAPDVYLDPDEGATPTSAIVMLSSD